ncbi:dienelactone hydrolase family protein, partial [Pseudomonas sp. R2.Fl]|nr:dienelactone hydrolase family protein [Pseudomonas sp. R2.Fl]
MVTTRRIEVRMEQGVAEAALVMPEGAKAGMPGVILYMDAFGVRPALVDMAQRFAAEGYAVLVPDLFYRYPGKGEFDAKTSFKVPETAAQLRGMISGTSQAMTAADTGDFIAALDEAGATGPIGTAGYCMGGARAITAAGTYPDRIVAAA